MTTPVRTTILVHGTDTMGISSNDPSVSVKTMSVPCQRCTYPKCQCKDYCYKCAGATHPTKIK